MFNSLMKNLNFVAISAITIISITICTGFLFNIKESSGVVNSKNDMSVLYAGSLSNIFENHLKPIFENLTNYNLKGEGRGSLQLSNLITDGFRRPDIFISADTIPIKNLMNNNPPLAGWFVKFASAEIVIAYNQQSTFASDFLKVKKGTMEWYNILEKVGFKFGRSDPKLDPKGYYTIIVTELATIFYNDSTIKKRILGDDNNKKQIFPEEVLSSILEIGQVDAISAYKHEAIAKKLPYITLPNQINLGDPNNTKYYNQ
ncbi:MAG: extracellular solute-binding protein, partial [Nitrososphaeraceae archaeon]|nr:extracellular solute-binding protein [Nitrososphaeraceae archaeon]